MICTSPIKIKNKSTGEEMTVPCGQCKACRLNFGREWALRICHEMLYHEKSCFLTLTYDDEHLPENGSLDKRDVQLFFKRLRKNTGLPLRYFCSGEYGDLFDRPHYHYVIFGISSDDDVFLNKHYSKKAKGFQCLMREWDKGHCFVGEVTPDSAAYVAKYQLKKVKGKHANEHYESLGIIPEFAIMSRNPGIGYDFVVDHQKFLFDKYGIRFKGKITKLPRYYESKIFDDDEKSERMAEKELFRAEQLKQDYDDFIKYKLKTNDTKSYHQFCAEALKATEINLSSQFGKRFK